MQFSGSTTLHTQQMTQQCHVFGLLRAYRNVTKRQWNNLINTQRKVNGASDWQSPNRFEACKNNPRAADIDKSQRNKIKPTKVLLQKKKVSLTFSTGGNLGDRGSRVVKALCYKSEGRWFDSLRRARWKVHQMPQRHKRVANYLSPAPRPPQHESDTHAPIASDIGHLTFATVPTASVNVRG